MVLVGKGVTFREAEVPSTPASLKNHHPSPVLINLLRKLNRQAGEGQG